MARPVQTKVSLQFLVEKYINSFSKEYMKDIKGKSKDAAARWLARKFYTDKEFAMAYYNKEVANKTHVINEHTTNPQMLEVMTKALERLETNKGNAVAVDAEYRTLKTDVQANEYPNTSELQAGKLSIGVEAKSLGGDTVQVIHEKSNNKAFSKGGDISNV